MPKVSKKSTNKSSQEIGSGPLTSKRPLPLGQLLLEEEHRNKYAVSKPKTNHKKSSTQQQRNEDGEELLDEKTSRRILQLGALQQREELELEQQQSQQLMRSKTRSANNRSYTNRTSSYQPHNDISSSEDDDQSMEEEEDEDDALHVSHVVRHTEGYVTVDGPDLSDAEGAADDLDEQGAANTDKMVTTNQQRRTLADIILSKIRDKEADAAHNTKATDDLVIPGQLPPKVVEVSVPSLRTHHILWISST
jgi:hypothetical protein